MDPDVYFKKIVALQHEGHALQLRVTQDLFSSSEVDVGTKLLLRSLAEAGIGSARKILDLGCGYGPIGLALKAADPSRTVHMVDRDALAVEYTRQNAALNRMSGVEAYGSLGYDDVRSTDFDLIASNLPGKAGEAVISSLLRDAAAYLTPEGRVAVVVVAALQKAVEETLAGSSNIEVVFRKASPRYAVFHYRFSRDIGESSRPPESAVARGIYHRQRAVSSPRVEYELDTAYGLPEFDSPGFQSLLLMEAMQSLGRAAVGRAVVFDPGQGHVPVALWKCLSPDTIDLVDRDLLGLRYSRDNLVLNGCPGDRVALFHQVGLLTEGRGEADLIVGRLREDEGTDAVGLAVSQAAQQLFSDGTVIVAGSSTAVTRLVGFAQSQKLLRVANRKRRKGSSVLVLKPR